MKKVITILVLILAIAVSGFYIYLDFPNKKEDVEIVKKDEVKKEIVPIVKTKEVKLGDMVLNISENLEINNVNDSLVLKFKGSFKNVDIKDNSLFFYLNYSKDSVLMNSSLEDWFDQNGPQTEKTSASSLYDEEKKVNNLSYIESLYEAPTSRMASSFYNVKVLYFKNKSDIYEITYFNKSNNPKISLTPEEEKSIQNYEKIVDEIIKSIRFVD